jgi:hypothetical protein
MTVLACALFFITGLATGLLTKGISINITHKQDVDKTPSDTGYNSSYGIPEVKQYLDNQYKVGDE